MTGKLLLLTGAPESHRLDWTTPDLLSTFQASIAQFAQLQPAPSVPPAAASQHQQQDRSVLDLAVWRALPLVRTHIRTGFSQQHDPQVVGAFPSSADFLTTASIPFSQGPSQDEADGEGSRLLTEFYEHSLAVHGHVASSQLVGQQRRAGGGGGGGGGGEVGTDTSFVSDTTNSSARSPVVSSDGEDEGDTTTLPAGGGTPTHETPLRPGRGPGGGGGGRGGADHLSDLEDIPPASYLLSIVPQTMTVTLIVGIISIAAPRTVETRYGATRTLVEVLVGDETKSGFSVTFWLSDHDGAEGGTAAGGVLAGLRSQDVVLMQNVALNVFRNMVYGGSLRRDWTRVHLLYRGRVGEGDVGGFYSQADLAKPGRGRGGKGHPQLEKTRRVKDWVLRFVGGGASVSVGGKSTGNRKGKERGPPPRNWNQPPPLDSQ